MDGGELQALSHPLSIQGTQRKCVYERLCKVAILTQTKYASLVCVICEERLIKIIPHLLSGNR